MSKIVQIALLEAADQTLMAIAAFCQKAAPLTANPVGSQAYAYGQKLAQGLDRIVQAGCTAIQTEFNTQNTAEKTLATVLGTLPPIT